MLYELEKKDFGKVSNLLSIVDHNNTVVESVLLGNNAGRVFVDNVNSPSAALIYPQEMFFYIVLSKDADDFLQEVNRLLFVDWKAQGVELFVYPEAQPRQLEILLGDRPHVKLVRREYRLNIENHRSSGLLPSAEYVLQQIDSDFFEAHPVDLMPGWTREDFIRHGFGYSIMRGDELVSQCVVACRADRAVELSVKTSESYRRCGLAVPVCSAVIDQAIGLGLTPTWSCWEFNEASWRLAEKLGLELKTKKQVYLWDAWVQKKHDAVNENDQKG